MTKTEAKEVLKWYKEKESECHFLARFKSSKPFHLAYPDASEKKRIAQITLGVHQWQTPYDKIIIKYPNLTRERYDAYRVKHGITKSQKS